MSNTEAALELQLTLQAITYILKPDHVEQLRSYRGPLHRRRLRSGAHLQLERELDLWIAHVNSLFRMTSVGVSIAIIKMKAIEIAAKYKFTTFKASNGWVSRYLKRAQLARTRLHGHAGAVDVSEYKADLEVLRATCDKYPLDHIFNMDETGESCS